MSTIRKSVLVALLYLGLACFIWPKASIAQQIDLTVMPPAMELLIKPGAQVRVPYTITNRSDNVSIVPTVKTFSVIKDEKSVEFGSAEGLPIKASFYDSGDGSEAIHGFNLKIGATKKIFLNLVVPESTPEGDYYLSFLAETQPEHLDKQYSARIKTQIASPILITVSKNGKTQAKGNIHLFEIGGKVFDSFDSVPLSLHVKNQGRNVVYATGNISISGFFGEKAVYPLYSQNILANSEKMMSTRLSQGEHSAVFKGFFIGRYTVVASVILADGTVQLNRSASFFAFPFKIVLFAVIGTIVGFIVIRRKR